MFATHGARMARGSAMLVVGLMAASPALGAVNPDDPRSVRDAYASTIAANDSVATGWTGSTTRCQAGVESATSKAATIANVNFFRQMNRLAPVGLAGSAVNAKAQAAALMFEANNQLSHTPATSWRCYSAAGAEAAGRSNIALGIAGAPTVSAYIEDAGDFNDAAGHRRWILYPRARTFGTGATSRAQTLWVIDGTEGTRPTSDLVGWPAKGYVPWPLMYERWSISSNRAPEADYRAARVSVTTAGTRLTVTKEQVHDGYADNTLVFKVAIPQALRDAGGETAFDVTVTNVLVDGASRTFTYRTTAIPTDTTNVPAAVTATVDNTQATVRWEPPVQSTGPVDAYRVEVVNATGGRVFLTDTSSDQCELMLPLLGEAFYRVDVRTIVDGQVSTPTSRMFTIGNPAPAAPVAGALRRVSVHRIGQRSRYMRLSLRADSPVTARVQRWSTWRGRWVNVRRVQRPVLDAGVAKVRIGRFASGRYRVVVATPARAGRRAAQVAVRFRVR